MNLVGKIFTVIIFLLCIMFTSMATMVFATHQNWLLASLAQTKALADATKKYNELTNEKTALADQAKREHDAEEAKIAQLQTAVNELTPKLAASEKLVLERDDQIRGLAAAAKSAHLTLDSARSENEKLRTEARDALAERDKRYTELVKATDELHNAIGEREQLSKSNGDLVAQLAIYRKYFQITKQDPKNADKNVPAELEGVVTAVLGTGEIEISVGSDDGLKKGHTLEVIRSGSPPSYVGRLVVDRLSGNRAVCYTDKSMQRSAIQKGDYVLTSASLSKFKR